MNKKDKTVKRLYQRIDALETKMTELAEAISQIVIDLSIRVDEIEEVLEIDDND